MKVGLCTRYENRNYGSMLQAYATVSAIKKLNHQCELIRYKKQYTPYEVVRQAPRIMNPGNIVKIRNSISTRQLANRFPEIEACRKGRRDKFDCFRDKTFTSLSPVYFGYQKLREGSKRYQAVIVGSDQLWLPIGLPTNFFNLQFVADGVRRVSYATSFGVSTIPWYQRARTADYLKRIDYLSVREDQGAVICNEVANLHARVVVDPTLLFDRGEWNSLIPDKAEHTGGYIFCYFLGNNHLCRDMGRALSKRTGLPIITLRHLDEIIPDDEAFGDYAPYDVDPSDFVNLIRHADYVLTDSFHGTVFSILNRKQFISFYRYARQTGQSTNSRLDSLLSHLKISNRLVVNEAEFMQSINSSIDYDNVEDYLAPWRAESWAFLEGALS